MVIIESKRLFLRTVNIDDVGNLYREIFSDIAVVKHTFGKQITNKTQAQTFIEKSCNFDGVFGLSAIVERASGNLIGLGGVLECSYLATLDYEFGFILGKKHWGKGYAREIGQAQIDFIKTQTNATRVLALVSPSNLNSLKTLKNLGLEYSTTLKAGDRGDRQVHILTLSRKEVGGA